MKTGSIFKYDKKKKTTYCQHSGRCDKDRPCFDPIEGDDCPYFEPTKAWSNIRGKQLPVDDKE